MSRSVNEVRLIGNTGDTPTINHTGNGMTVARISLATTSRRKDRDGNAIERTEWHRVVAFGKLAEIVEEYVGKGAKLYIDGEIRYSKYTDNEGVERYGTDIVANEIIMLDGRRSEGRDDAGQGYEERPQQRIQQRQGGGERQQRANGGGQYRGNGSSGGRPAQQAQYNQDLDRDIPF